MAKILRLGLMAGVATLVAALLMSGAGAQPNYPPKGPPEDPPGKGKGKGKGGSSLTTSSDDGTQSASNTNGLPLVLWAVVLAAGGAALVSATRRGSFRPLTAVASRLRPRSTQRPALPEPDVPFMDTRGFVPVRAREPDAKNTEADV